MHTRSARGVSGGDVLTRSSVPTQPGELPVVPQRTSASQGRLIGSVGGGPMDVRTFTRTVREQLNQIEAHARADVSRGVLSAEALEVLRARKGLIETTLREIVRDGQIESRETDQLQMLLTDLEDQVWQNPVTLGTWPGGARYWR
jgi:hypothetical protein